MLFFTVMCSCLLFACKKDNNMNSKELLAFIKSDGPSVHQADIAFIRTPVSLSGDSVARLAAYLTRETSADVMVSVGVDESQLAIYNQNNKSNFVILPAANYKIIGPAQLNIKAGEVVSADSLKIQLLDRLKLNDLNGYILPLSVKEVSSKDKGVQASSSYRTVFIKAASKYTNIDLSKKTTPAGTLIDRTNPSWSIISASTPYSSSYPAINVLDGKNNTYWFAGGADNNIVLDMSAVNAVKGFILAPTYAFGTSYNATKIEVLTSTDNQNWVSQGAYTTDAVLSSSSANAPDYRNINFYGPVTCRYVKFILNGGMGSGYNGFAEINAIK